MAHPSSASLARSKSWADIASDSDDDSVGMHHPANQPPPKEASVQEEPEPAEEEVVIEEEEGEVPPKEYNWPTEPPFTAYVGNLPYSVKESEELSQAIQDLLGDRFQATVSITKSRLAIDRQDNRPRGFGYVEVETVDDLKTVMRLNDGKSLFKGRPLKLDVASPPSNQSRRSLNRSSSRGESSRSVNSEVDGSSFRGGRYINRRDSSSSLRRQSSVSSDTSETRMRPSLKLAPRSKPNTDGDQKESSQSSLFGGGKARDEGEWERRRSETKQQQQDRRGSASSATVGGGGQDRRGSASSATGGGGQDRRGSAPSPGGGGGGQDRRGSASSATGGSGQDRRGSASSTGGGGGGRGRGNKGRGRGGGRGRGKDGSKKNLQKESMPKEAEVAPKAVLKPPPTVEPPKPATTKVQNKFSALNMDSDSD